MKSSIFNHKIKAFPFACLVATLVMCTAFAASPDSKPLAFAVLLAGITVIFAFVRSAACTLLVTIPAALIGLYTGSIEIAVLIGSASLAIGIGAFLIRMLKHPAILLVCLPISYLLAFFAGASPVRALLILIYVPACIVCACVTGMKKERVFSICAVSVTLGVCLTVAATVALLVHYGSVGENPFVYAADKLFEFLVKYYTEEHLALAEKYAAAGIDTSKLGLTAYDARLYTVSVFGILPALAVIAANGIAFVSHRIHITLLDNAGLLDFSDVRGIVFLMSPASAIIYIVAYFVMTVCSYSNSETAELIAQNVYLILLPGLFITGVFFLIGRIRAGKRFVLWIVLVVLIAFMSLNLALAVVAFIGSSFIIITYFRRMMSSKDEDE